MIVAVLYDLVAASCQSQFGTLLIQC